MTTAIMPGTLAPFSAPAFESRALLNLLIVDDDRLVREACREAATSLGYRATTTDSADQALWLVESQSFDGVLLGLKLSDPARVALLRQIKQRRPGVEVVVMTTNAAAQPAVEMMKAGAFDYLIKPFGLQEVKLVLDAVSAQLKAKVETRRLGEKIKCNGFGGIIGRAPEMDKLYRIISKAAQSAHPVLILGESGTGKELVARAIHYSGPFRDKPFVPVDFPTIIFYESGYSLHTLRQASRRSWRIGQRRRVRVKFLCHEGTMQTVCLRLMGKKLLVALTMEGKFAGEGLQNIDEDDDMLSAMARELVERNGIGDTADAVWKALNTEHQKLFPATSRSDGDVTLIEAPAMLPGGQPDPAALVEEALAENSVLIFGQRPGSLSGRRPRGRPSVPEQASLFG